MAAKNAHIKGKEEGIEIGVGQGIEIGVEQGIEIGVGQGIEIGVEKGIVIGVEQGIEIGVEKGKEEARIEMAKGMLEMGMSIQEVARISGLSIERLQFVMG
jgi:hypothetical protein